MPDHDSKHEEGAAGGDHKPHKSHGPPHAAHEEHQGCPEWLISFADNTALLMGFFVILLAMNMTPKTKQGTIGEGPGGTNDAHIMDWMLSIREGFNNPPDINSPNPKEKALALYAQKRDREKKANKNNPAGDFPDSKSQPDGTVNQFGASIAFDTNSAVLKDGELASLKLAAEKLKGQKWIIEIRGHTSSQEMASDRRDALLQAQPEEDPALNGRNDSLLFPQRGKYVLSYLRAVAVADKLVEHGIEPRRLRIVGCSDNERQVPRAGNPREHTTNQRVELRHTQELMKEDPNAFDPGQPGR